MVLKGCTFLFRLDGLLTLGRGGYSFGIFEDDANPIYHHHGPVHGDSEQQNSTRSEMRGILGLVIYLQYLSTKYKLDGEYPHLRVPGDNIESLRCT